jgi:predicted ribosome quality control (RQC) complex YloA/Tae2 family protein
LCKRLNCVLLIGMSAYSNASAMYTNKKAAHAKELKTADASTKALQAVETQTNKALGKQNLTRTLRAARKVHWFEKFNWYDYSLCREG